MRFRSEGWGNHCGFVHRTITVCNNQRAPINKRERIRPLREKVASNVSHWRSISGGSGRLSRRLRDNENANARQDSFFVRGKNGLPRLNRSYYQPLARLVDNLHFVILLKRTLQLVGLSSLSRYDKYFNETAPRNSQRWNVSPREELWIAIIKRINRGMLKCLRVSGTYRGSIKMERD